MGSKIENIQIPTKDFFLLRLTGPEDQIIIPAENTKEDLEIDEVDTTTAAEKRLAEDENDLTSGAGDDSVMEKIVDDSILMAGNQGNNGEENPMKTKLVENVTQFQVLNSLLKYIKILFSNSMFEFIMLFSGQETERKY